MLRLILLYAVGVISMQVSALTTTDKADIPFISTIWPSKNIPVIPVTRPIEEEISDEDTVSEKGSLIPETRPINDEASAEDMVIEKQTWIPTEEQTKDSYSDVQTELAHRRPMTGQRPAGGLLRNFAWDMFRLPTSSSTDRSAVSMPLNKRVVTNTKVLRRRALANGLNEAANTVLDNVKDHIRPAEKMFDDASNLFTQKLGQEAKILYERFQDQKAGGSPPPCLSALSELTENDVKRLLTTIAKLPTHIQDKLLYLSSLTNMTKEELKYLPTDIIPVFGIEVMDSLKALTGDQLYVLCENLMQSTSPPRNLRKALQGGINCHGLLDKLSWKAGRGKSQSMVMMQHIRNDKQPSSWSVAQVTRTFRYLTSALSKEDIEEIPIATIRKSLKDISHVHIPTKSVRYGLMKKLNAEYSSPTMFPDAFLESMGRVLDDMNVQDLILLRNDAVLKLAPKLTAAGVWKDTTRIALTKNMARALRAAPHPEKIANVIHWMKTDTKFMKDLNLTNLLAALSTVNVSFTFAEANMIAERLEQHHSFIEAFTSNSTAGNNTGNDIGNNTGNDIGNNTGNATDSDMWEDVIGAIGIFVDGLDMAYLESLPADAFPAITLHIKHVGSRPKSRLILRKLRSSKYGRVLASDIGPLFNGVDMGDIDEMSAEEIIASLPDISKLNLPYYIGRKIVKKIVSWVFDDNMTVCSDGFHRLGNLAKHVKPRFIVENKVLPITIDQMECDLNFDQISLTKAQAYAVLDNVREALLTQSPDSEDSVFTATIIARLGKLVRGLRADDIEGMPLDTDLLSVLELLSKYEDDLDTSQVEAIADKIRDYFGIEHRNLLTDVDDVTILQIGRFLQYLNSDFELTKFPKHLRALITQEIGKSYLLKIATGKRQALLSFALTSMVTGGNKRTEIDENDLMDLGSLRCGLTESQIKMLTKTAIEVHLEDLQMCPLKQPVAEALVQKALDYNINRLQAREQMATMGALLLRLQDSDMLNLDEEELAGIMDYVAKSTIDVEETVRTTEGNGFIRERTSRDDQQYREKRKHLIGTAFKAMRNVYGPGKCHELIRLRELGTDVADLLDVSELERCMDYIGSLDWDPDTARKLLDRLSDVWKLGRLDMKQLMENSRHFLELAPRLIKGLSADEFKVLNMSHPDTIADMGDTEGLSKQQLESGFETWLSQRQDTGDITGDELANMKTFACGVSADFIKSNIDKIAVRESADVLGKEVRKCDLSKLKAYSSKMSAALGGKSHTWPLHEIAQMGSLLGGLSKHDLSSFIRRQVKSIEPDVISYMPPEQVKEFTAEQLGDMTPQQAQAITSMQRSYMSQEQTDALQFDNQISGGDCTVQFDYIVLVVCLATIRQLLCASL